MGDAENLKNHILKELKKEEWRKNINNEEYTNTTNLIEELHTKNLEIVSERNKSFKEKKITGKQPSVGTKVSLRARIAYEKWKEKNSKDKPCPEVSVQNLLLLIHYLNSDSSKDEQRELHDCLKRQNSEFETFWDSPSYILKVLRRCVLTRDWSNMTYFSLILLNYDKKYLHVVKNMCRIMVKFNPLIKECDLEDQFQTLLKTETEKLVIV